MECDVLLICRTCDNNAPTTRYGHRINMEVDVTEADTPEKMTSSPHFVANHKPPFAERRTKVNVELGLSRKRSIEPADLVPSTSKYSMTGPALDSTSVMIRWYYRIISVHCSRNDRERFAHNLDGIFACTFQKYSIRDYATLGERRNPGCQNTYQREYSYFPQAARECPREEKPSGIWTQSNNGVADLR
jgi:hypothetical protein